MAQSSISGQGRQAGDPHSPVSVPNWRSAGLRYHKYSHYLRERFGSTVGRVTVDGGFTCPNVDGSVAVGGCVYCDNRSFSPARRGPRIPVASQIRRGLEILGQYKPATSYLAYFQAGTNTYDDIDRLERLYDEALAQPGVVGLVIGTRPDCADDDVLDLLERYAQRVYVSVEYGLQSIHERSLQWMNRGHDAACFFDAVQRTKHRGISIGSHLILGLPGESRDDMRATADALARSGVDSVKIHNLYVVKGTPLEEQYRQGLVSVLERDEYCDLLIDIIERLPGELVVERVTGDAPADFLVAPSWVSRKAEFLHRLETELARRDTWQGRACSTDPAR